jgi:hypothetical protein
MQPVRKIGYSNRSITGKRSSAKTDTVHQFESALERDFLTLLEYDDTISNYVVQPVTIRYEHENKSARYTPDVIVYYKPRLKLKPVLYEVKYAAELIEKRGYYEPKFNAARKYAYGNGFEFKVITEKEIRTVYLQNIKFLSSYCRTPIDQRLKENIKSQLQHREMTPQDFMQSNDQGENAKLLHTLWQLLAQKIISCDMQNKLTMTTPLWNQQISG